MSYQTKYQIPAIGAGKSVHVQKTGGGHTGAIFIQHYT